MLDTVGFVDEPLFRLDDASFERVRREMIESASIVDMPSTEDLYRVENIEFPPLPLEEREGHAAMVMALLTSILAHRRDQAQPRSS